MTGVLRVGFEDHGAEDRADRGAFRRRRRLRSRFHFRRHDAPHLFSKVFTSKDLRLLRLLRRLVQGLLRGLLRGETQSASHWRCSSCQNRHPGSNPGFMIMSLGRGIRELRIRLLRILRLLSFASFVSSRLRSLGLLVERTSEASERIREVTRTATSDRGRVLRTEVTSRWC